MTKEEKRMTNKKQWGDKLNKNKKTNKQKYINIEKKQSDFRFTAF